jgi:hypothetical protein
VSFAAITLCVASQRVFIVVYFVNDTVRKLLDTPSYTCENSRCELFVACDLIYKQNVNSHVTYTIHMFVDIAHNMLR